MTFTLEEKINMLVRIDRDVNLTKQQIVDALLGFIIDANKEKPTSGIKRDCFRD